MLHEAPAASVAPHVLVCAKSPASPPVKPMLAMLSVAVPVLRRVAVCAALVVPTWPAKVRLDGVSEAAGAMPVPVSPELCGEPGGVIGDHEASRARAGGTAA